MAVRNGYDVGWVDALVRKEDIKRLNNEASILQQHTPNTKYMRLSYIGPLSTRLGNVFHNHDIRVAYKSPNTLYNLLVHNKDSVPLLQRSGVYKLTCGDPNCNVVYIGRTSRTLQQRISEHLRSQRRDNCDKSIFGRHLRLNNHPFDPEKDARIIHPSGFGLRQSVLEEIEIFCHIDDVSMVTLNSLSTHVFPRLFDVLKREPNVERIVTSED
ncbi:uncharacterized protein LOC123323009 [Coccinella septempunctata]|uniref:uncharacterized protein LOC123323009 n=1 Tax=Coccinella septempunctata TaxID=41139 RepID=UPI001D079249|nr:uncharacterized protein LOC123323009 [Coccinella septempunctata]